jgi:thiol-disulfide isomerase/thioredoxin
MRGRAARGQARSVPFALALGLALACDTGSDAPPKSRVQAVLTDPANATVEPQPEPQGAATGQLSKAAKPGSDAPAKPRAVLCDGQLSGKPAPFKPKSPPVRVSLDSASELAKDPLQRERGHWLWVNFWAAWCVPCKQELPLLFSWQKALKDEITFRFVSMDDDERQLRDFLGRDGQGGLTETYWLPDGGVRRAWLEALDLQSEPELPLQLLIDPKGMLRCRVQGAVEAEDLATLRSILRKD